MTTETTNEAPARGTPEYNEMMASRADRGFQTEAELNPRTMPEPEAPQRPENVPEKFWNAEKGEINVDALLQSYTELEKMRGQQQQTQDAPQQESEGQQQQAENQAQEAVEAAGLNWNDLQSRFEQTGQVSDDDRAALNKIGIPNEVIDNYVDMLSASQEFAVMRTAEYAGGKEVLDGLMERAAKELSPEENQSYNAMLSSPNWRVAIDGLKARFGADVQSRFDANDLFAGVTQTNQGTAVRAFSSRREMSEAINARDERGRRLYDVDPAYRERIRRQIAASNV